MMASLVLTSGGANMVGETRPLWEFGLFGLAARFPQYKGSDEYFFYALPLPYMIYRGSFLESDRDGMRGILFKTESFQSDISISGNPPVRNNNSAREGMPDLDPILEIGPALKWYPMKRFPDKAFYVQAAARPVISVDLNDGGFDLRGLHNDLSVYYTHRRLFGEDRWGGGANVGVYFSNRKYHRFFYDVDPPYAREDRPVYRADAGYGGFWVSAYLLRKVTPDVSFGTYASWVNMDGSAFEDSPLVCSKNNYLVGCALIWTLAKSERRVRAEDGL